MAPGIHLIHKPVGPTSFSVVQACMQRLGNETKKRPRLCHGGTLDPFASGLLLILVEPATKLFEYLHAVPKVYQATVKWGEETDNGDPGGQITFTGDASRLTAEQLESALAKFAGWQEQIPPATSNKRIDGERAYLKAHRGEEVILPASRVYLHGARWIGHDLPRESRIELVVRGGYYVRSLARDLGRMLGCGAHLSQLHRNTIGPWNDPGPDQELSVTSRGVLPWLPAYELSDQDVGDLRRGLSINPGALLAPDWPLPDGFPAAEPLVRGFHFGKFCFLLRPREGRLELITALRGGM